MSYTVLNKYIKIILLLICVVILGPTILFIICTLVLQCWVFYSFFLSKNSGSLLPDRLFSSTPKISPLLPFGVKTYPNLKISASSPTLLHTIVFSTLIFVGYSSKTLFPMNMAATKKGVRKIISHRFAMYKYYLEW